MHVLWHDHITDQPKLQLVADFHRFPHENIACTRALQQRQPPIATKRHKVQVPSAKVPPQSFRHSDLLPNSVSSKRQTITNPRPRFKNRTWGTLRPTFPQSTTVISSPCGQCQPLKPIPPGPPVRVGRPLHWQGPRGWRNLLRGRGFLRMDWSLVLAATMCPAVMS